MAMEAVVSVSDLTKSYDPKLAPAVNSVSFQIGNAELFGVIGPDGAGKTSLFRLLSSLVKPEFGQACIFGFDTVNEYSRIRKKMGYVPGRFSLYPDLSIAENLQFFAGMAGNGMTAMRGQVEVIYRQIEPFKNRRAGQLSGGMKQKLALCCALIHNPDILFLDEPTTGVDPVARREFWTILKGLKESGVTVVVSTAYMDEATMCDRVALMHEGDILALDTPEKLIKCFAPDLYEIKSRNRFALISLLRTFPEVISVYAFGAFCHLILEADFNETSLLGRLALAGQEDVVFRRATPNIEDYFIHLLQNDQC